MPNFVIGLLFGLAIVVLAYVLAYGLMAHRAKGMRSLASAWGFRYIGPSASRWRSSRRSRLEVESNLPSSFPRTCHPPLPFKQVWNVIEGQRSGVSILIFDSIIGVERGTGRYCTFIAIETEENPFVAVPSTEKVVHSHEWTGLYRLRFLQFPWTMDIQQIKRLLNNLPY